MADRLKVEQRHGKSRVRVARVWRKGKGEDAEDVVVEWKVAVSLLSDCLPAYTHSDNSAIVATDTIKNTVYVKAKECSEVVSAEEFAVLLGKHFVTFYPQVTAATITVLQKPWERVTVDGKPHEHGFRLGSEKHTVEVTIKKSGSLDLRSGIEGLALLKTTKSGFEGFVRDQYTTLPETRERMLATEITAVWRYPFQQLSDVPFKTICFLQMYEDVKKLLVDTFFGPSAFGVYSPSVQNTLYLIGKTVLYRFPGISSIKLLMPNVHFLPVNLPTKDNPVIVKFADDVYTPTDEPHGTIEATVSRPVSRM